MFSNKSCEDPDMEKTGWLKKQLNQVEQEVREWPKWKQDVHTQKTKNEPVSSTPKPTRQHEREKVEGITSKLRGMVEELEELACLKDMEVASRLAVIDSLSLSNDRDREESQKARKVSRNISKLLDPE